MCLRNISKVSFVNKYGKSQKKDKDEMSSTFNDEKWSINARDKLKNVNASITYLAKKSIYKD